MLRRFEGAEHNICAKDASSKKTSLEERSRVRENYLGIASFVSAEDPLAAHIFDLRSLADGFLLNGVGNSSCFTTARKVHKPDSILT